MEDIFMPDLKLGRLPDRTPIKISFSASPELNKSLSLYADLYRETYGHDEPVPELIPFMLQTFLERDRAFQKASKERAAPNDSIEHSSAGRRSNRSVQAAAGG
jgi:hypothetical protein